jgi:DNA-binding MurR/RpiR family transcriptional regulator
METKYHSEVASRIGKAYQDLSAGHRQIADFILKSPAEAAMMTIVELASRCNVSNATANRFAKAIGFKGFADFRASQMDALRMDMAPAEKLRTEIDENASNFDIIRNALKQDLDNLQNTLDGLDEASCRRAVDLILAAQRIFTFGSGISYYIAGMLTHGLEPFCRGNVSMMGATGGATAAYRRLVHSDENDLIVLVSFPRYSPGTVELAEAARRRNTRVLCITDSPTSPLTRYADEVLFAQAKRSLLPNSATSAFALVEGIVAAVANRRSEGADVHLRLAQRYLPDISKLSDQGFEG